MLKRLSQANQRLELRGSCGSASTLDSDFDLEQNTFDDNQHLGKFRVDPGKMSQNQLVGTSF